MLETRGDTLKVKAPMRMDNARQLTTAGVAQLDASVGAVDLGSVQIFDASALAILLAWLRHARAQGVDLQIRQAPPGLIALAGLYGLDTLLPLASANQ